LYTKDKIIREMTETPSQSTGITSAQNTPTSAYMYIDNVFFCFLVHLNVYASLLYSQSYLTFRYLRPQAVMSHGKQF